MIPCPRCKRTVPDDAETCPHCGLDLQVLRSFEAVRRDLEEARTAVARELDRLQAKVRTLESLIAEQLGESTRPSVSRSAGEERPRDTDDPPVAAASARETGSPAPGPDVTAPNRAAM